MCVNLCPLLEANLKHGVTAHAASCHAIWHVHSSHRHLNPCGHQLTCNFQNNRLWQGQSIPMPCWSCWKMALACTGSETGRKVWVCVRGGERLLNLDNSSRYDRRGNQLAVCPIGNGELVSITDQPEAKCTGQVTINLFLTPPTPTHTDTHTHTTECIESFICLFHMRVWRDMVESHLRRCQV